jgi:hypothetical protein
MEGKQVGQLCRSRQFSYIWRQMLIMTLPSPDAKKGPPAACATVGLGKYRKNEGV